MDDIDARRALREMVAGSGMSAYRLSRTIGRSKSYVSTLLESGSMPGVDTFVQLAHACGYEVEVTGHGARWRLSPDGPTIRRLEALGGSLDRVVQDARTLGAVDVRAEGGGYVGIDDDGAVVVRYV